MKRFPLAVLGLFVLVAGCGAPGQPAVGGAPSAAGSAQPSSLKRIAAAIKGDPYAIYEKLIPSTNIPGIDALDELVNAGLVRLDNYRGRHAILAEQVPSLDNGRWKLLPGGRMEMTWRIREGAQWHDGVPFTSADVLFTAMLERDEDLPLFRDPAHKFTERIDAPDARTITVTWSQPYIKADTLFMAPVARHLLEQAYGEDKATFTEHPYWSKAFVGTGPFQLRQWVAGSHLVLEANGRFALGRPKIDQIEVKFIPDENTLIANLLAGTLDITLGRGIALEQALQIREQWREGRMEVVFLNFVAAYPQFVNPNPPVVANARFRRALIHALDRQQMADALQGGAVPVAHSLVNPNEPDYPAIEPHVIRYDYDPRLAIQLLEGIGYTRGPDGVFRDAARDRLAVEIRATTARAVNQKAMLALADQWQHVGVIGEPFTTPPQLAADRERRSNYPAFEIAQQPNDLESFDRLHSSQSPLPENNYRIVGNRSRYKNPEFDALIERFLVTIPKIDRLQLIGQIVRHMTEEALTINLFYGADPTLANRRLANVTAKIAWNAHEWDLE
jgi:peptide/nickel transport system substrate-binding protein